METVGERIKKMRLEKNWTQKDLALHLGLKNDTAIANYESNYSIPKDDIKYKLCEIFDCTMDYLMGNSYYKNYEDFVRIDELTLNYKRTAEETQILCAALNYLNTHENVPIGNVIDNFTANLPINKQNLLKSIIEHLHYRYHGTIPDKSNSTSSTNNLHMCPVYGQICAGQPNWAEECLEGYLPIDPNLMGIINPEECFFLRVDGESMNKIIRNGAYALIRKQNVVENGDIAVVLIDGCDATLKKFSQNGNIVILNPQSNLNEFEPLAIDLTHTHVEILGKYIGKFEMNV